MHVSSYTYVTGPAKIDHLSTKSSILWGVAVRTKNVKSYIIGTSSQIGKVLIYCSSCDHASRHNNVSGSTKINHVSTKSR